MNKKTKITVTANSASPKRARFFAGYTTAKEIEQEGEYYAMVKSARANDATGQMIITLAPFDNGSGRNVFFEDVPLFVDRVSSPTSAAGQFLTLFSEARHWGDLKDRIVGIELKINQKEGRVYKNVIRVFGTELDELIFDDIHMASPPAASDGGDEPVGEGGDTPIIRQSRKITAVLDDEDDDLDLMEDDEDGRV